MTITTSTARTQYSGNGSTTNFATGFYFTSNSQIKVIRTVIATGVDTTLVNPTDFTVTGAGNPAGGTVACVVAPASGTRLTIFRQDDFTQNVNLTAYENFPAETVEDALDKLTIQTTGLNDAVNRSLQFSPGSTVTSAFTIESPIANRGLKYNASGTGIINTTDDPDGIVSAAAASASAAASSASSASTSASTATTQASNASTSASNAATSASNAATSATNASNSATAAATSATNAENSALSVGARLLSTSTTSMAVSSGSKTITVQANEGWAVGMFITVYRTSDIATFVTGQITAYNVATGQLDFSVNSDGVSGSGTFTDWTVVIGGRRGLSGAAAGTVFASGADTTQNFLTNKLVVAGSLAKTILNPGANEQIQITGNIKVKQITFGVLNTSASSTSSGFADTGLSATITPSSASNRVLVLCSADVKAEAGGTATVGNLRIIRGASTSIEGGPSGSWRVTPNGTASSVYTMACRVISDNPATTSALTYKLQFERVSGSGTIIVSEQAASYLVLIEYET